MRRAKCSIIPDLDGALAMSMARFRVLDLILYGYL